MLCALNRSPRWHAGKKARPVQIDKETTISSTQMRQNMETGHDTLITGSMPLASHTSARAQKRSRTSIDYVLPFGGSGCAEFQQVNTYTDTNLAVDTALSECKLRNRRSYLVWCGQRQLRQTLELKSLEEEDYPAHKNAEDVDDIELPRSQEDGALASLPQPTQRVQPYACGM